MTHIQDVLPGFQTHGHTTQGAGLAAANKAFVEQLIQTGRESAHAVVTKVLSEIPTDDIAKAADVGFAEKNGLVLIGWNDKAFGLHRHAIGQLCDDTKVPSQFFTQFLGAKSGGGTPWGAEMVAEVLNRTFANGVDPKKRFLMRSVKREVRGIMTDKYKRLDSEMILTTFLKATADIGVHPYKGLATDTRWYIQTVMDRVFEPVPGEPHAVGMSLGHSDFGQGALELNLFMLRLACTNGMISESALRQVHIGRRLEAGDIQYSKETYLLNSKATVSEVKDTIRSLMSPDAVDQKLLAMRAAYTAEIKPESAVESAHKVLGSKALADRIREKFVSADIVNMPAGQTKARWANAASFVANSEEDVDEKVKLQRYAADLLGISAALKKNRTVT